MVNQWNSYFASNENSDFEKWIQRNTTINGVEVYAYVLLSVFGEDDSFINNVSEYLVEEFFKSLELKRIPAQMSNLHANAGNIKHIEDQVILSLTNN